MVKGYSNVKGRYIQYNKTLRIFSIEIVKDALIMQFQSIMISLTSARRLMYFEMKFVMITYKSAIAINVGDFKIQNEN